MNDPICSFTTTADGPFDLAVENRHFGGWPTLPADPGALVMAFPIDGSEAAAAVVLRQDPAGTISGEVFGCPPDLAAAAGGQALATVSLDVDGSGWPQVGDRDPALGELQARYGWLRPVLFHSPYEAAAAFVIGHRISIKQGRALRAGLAAAVGTTIAVGGDRFAAFPSPGQILGAADLPGISAVKAERLRGVARAAEDGRLGRERLRKMPVDAALAELETLAGIGPFFAQGILLRGAGSVDGLTDDETTRFAVGRRYGLDEPVDRAAVRATAEAWRPYRMWAVVLLHVWVRGEVGLPPGRSSAARRGVPDRPGREGGRVKG